MESEAPSTPRNRLKFLCSYGGRILPRPSDGLLRYVGGETRVLSVTRSISFKDLKAKITGLLNTELVIKYQLIGEDLDALVTVKNDEDLYHMIDEYDRAVDRFRLFLFPYAAASAELSSPIARRYVDAINSGLPIAKDHHLSISNSAGGRMNRVRSTPNLEGEEMQTRSPQAYRKPSVAFGYSDGSRPGWRMGGNIGYGCGCNCGCMICTSQFTRKYVRSPSTPGGSPLGSSADLSPRLRGNHQFCSPSPIGVVWE